MKQEVYSCLKSLEALNSGLKIMWANGFFESVDSLQEQYYKICLLLKNYLSDKDYKLVQIIEPVNLGGYESIYLDRIRKELIQNLIVTSDMTIAHLRSLDMDLNQELINEKKEIKKQKEELETKTKQFEDSKKMFENSTKMFEELIRVLSNKKEGFSELMRSQLVENIKASHRNIEKNTNPTTKSQNPLELEKL